MRSKLSLFLAVLSHYIAYLTPNSIISYRFSWKRAKKLAKDLTNEYNLEKPSCFKILSAFLLFSQKWHVIIMKSLDPLRAKKTFIRKKFGHTAVSAIKASSVTL